MKSFTDRLETWWDNWMFAPHNLADRALSAEYDRVDRLAMQDVRYAEIEARRHSPGTAASIFLSEDDGLGWDEWLYQSEYQKKFRDRRWVPVAQFVRDRPLRTATSRARLRAQARHMQR